MFTLNLTAEEARVVWGALLELPAKHTFDLLLSVKRQLETQELARQQLPEAVHQE